MSKLTNPLKAAGGPSQTVIADLVKTPDLELSVSKDAMQYHKRQQLFNGNTLNIAGQKGSGILNLANRLPNASMIHKTKLTITSR